ncbi:F5F19.5 protein [Citrus sinensis]|nr:F5F19.5 protein [Citrus sinensis]
MKSTVSHYKEGFDSIRSLVDVGGGTSGALVEIVKSYPHIKVINFDLPHVVATTPMCEGVIHDGGDMFDPIPNANTCFMKWILHDWNDEACVKILKSYRKAILNKNGKLVFVVIFVQEDDNNIFGDMGLVFDLLMFAHTTSAKF